MSSAFSVVVAADDARTISVSGEIDVEHADDLTAVGLLTLQSFNGSPDSLTIDLAGVSFMDSTGLGALIAIRNAAVAEGRLVYLRGVRPRVAKLLAITGMSNVFDMDPAVEHH